MSKDLVTITSSVASLRQKPYMDSELADEVLFGMSAKVCEDYGDWLYVETDYGYKGYVNKSDVVGEEAGGWNKKNKATIIASFADVLYQPKFSADKLISIPRGSLIALTGEISGDWLQVELPKGDRGWTRKEAVQRHELKSGSELRQAIVDAALLYINTQYRWGGKTPMGIDCSGLSSMAYALNGITLPRDSEDQMNFMRKIHRKESKPGDLLFFPGHVAVYIGEDKFVHATGTGAAVKINSLNKSSKLYRKDLDEKYICTGTVF